MSEEYFYLIKVRRLRALSNGKIRDSNGLSGKKL